MEKESIFVVGFVVLFGILLLLGFLLKGERFTMYQEATGKSIEVKRGFSFTYMFFGSFVPLFRGHIGGFFLTFFVEVCSCGLAHLIFLFCYNGMYINWLANNGFRRLGIDETGKRSDGAINIQINTTPDHSTPYQDAKELIQPVNAQMESGDDEGKTVALSGNGELIGTGGMYQGAEIPIIAGEKIIIGRDGENSNLVIPNREISRKHCEITYDAYNQTYVICDYSTNGVYLQDSTRVAVQQPVYLQPGSVIRIGNTENTFQLK